ncbi:acyltransferase [Pararoseomonas indoligenes]|uniref:Acyltransferase n=1 Tax=Roseomonas indoligenes TaxID=2820811 RepID=A0A940MRU0_9PROT|nr:acyltransferase [Pararoseomonas indoligenes]MBP0492304.1 acyltransferase [Pararoseomonas indoligenes]
MTPEALEAAITGHPAWGGFFRQPREGYTFPALGTCQVHGAEDAGALAPLGIQVGGGGGEGNLVVLAGGQGGHHLRILFGGRKNCIAVIGGEGVLAGQVSFEGDDHLLVFNGRDTCHVNMTFRARHGALFFGKGATSNAADFLVEGPRRCIILGDDGMVAYRVSLRTSDSHGIISLDDPTAALNPPASVVLEPHVWIAKDAVVSRGVRVGRGAIIAMNTIVTADVAPCTLVGGVPMRVLRERVTWTRASQPGEAEIRAAIAAAAPD